MQAWRRQELSLFWWWREILPEVSSEGPVANIFRKNTGIYYCFVGSVSDPPNGTFTRYWLFCHYLLPLSLHYQRYSETIDKLVSRQTFNIRKTKLYLYFQKFLLKSDSFPPVVLLKSFQLTEQLIFCFLCSFRHLQELYFMREKWLRLEKWRTRPNTRIWNRLG